MRPGSTKKSLKKWERFEDLAADIQKQLAPTASVTQDEKVTGRRSKRSRQLDICVRRQVGQYEIFIVIDCKDYRRRVNIKDVESFMGLVEDVAANKGAIVAARGFTASAKERARDAGIDLYQLIDAQAHEWQSYVTIPAVVTVLTIDSYSLSFTATGRFFMEPQEFPTMLVYGRDGNPIDVINNLVADRWHDGTIPMQSGEHRDLPLYPDATFVKTGRELFPVAIRVNVRVSQKRYFGQLPLTEVQGFADELKGGMHTMGFKTDLINIADVQRRWQLLPDDGELSIKPLVGMGFTVEIPRITPRKS